MSNENAIRIPLYNLGQLSCVGERTGCGYNTKVYWGNYLLGSRPNLISALESAYVGIRLFSLDFKEWLTPKIREKALDAILKAFWLIDGRNTLGKLPTIEEGFSRTYNKDGLEYYMIFRVVRVDNILSNDPARDLIMCTARRTCSDGVKIAVSNSIFAEHFDYQNMLDSLLTNHR